MHNYTALWYHLVWSTKHRAFLIDKEWKWNLFTYLKVYCKEKEYYLDYINSMPDHVHLLISPKPKFALSDIVRNIKVTSYYWLKDENLCKEDFGWQDGYAAFTVSPTQVHKVRNYIKNQEEHHQNYDFEQELMILRDKSFVSTDS